MIRFRLTEASISPSIHNTNISDFNRQGKFVYKLSNSLLTPVPISHSSGKSILGNSSIYRTSYFITKICRFREIDSLFFLIL